MRLLLEISADVNFIKHYPENIPELIKKQEEVVNKQSAQSKYTYRDAISDAGEMRLYKYKNGKLDISLGSKGRIELTYKRRYGDEQKEVASKAYDLLCIYSHFNHAATIWEGNKSGSKNLDEALQDSLYLFRFYPLFLHCMVSGVGELLKIDELINYNPQPIHKLFEETERWEADA